MLRKTQTIESWSRTSQSEPREGFTWCWGLRSWSRWICSLLQTPSRCRSPGCSAHTSDSLTHIGDGGRRWRTYLDTADDGGGQCRVVLRAQQDGVHQNEAAWQWGQSGRSGDEAEQTGGGGWTYPMMQERTNCPANIGSRHPPNARPCARHSRASAQTPPPPPHKGRRGRSSPPAGHRSSRRTPRWAAPWSRRCNRAARICPAPAGGRPQR